MRELLNEGAVVAWAGIEGYFSDPPYLFDPSRMGGGVWAVLSPETGFVCESQLNEPFKPLPAELLAVLRDRVNETSGKD
jgi:hypothetical protein